MESFFRAVRNEFELNQHFEEDLLDQVKYQCSVLIRSLMSTVREVAPENNPNMTHIMRKHYIWISYLNNMVNNLQLKWTDLTAVGGRCLDLGWGQEVSQNGARRQVRNRDRHREDHGRRERWHPGWIFFLLMLSSVIFGRLWKGFVNIFPSVPLPCCA